MPRLTDKIAFVTGASSGIGEAIALRFLAEGALVIGCGRREQAGIKDDRFCYVRADLCNVDETRRALESAMAQHEGLDIVVNSAGMTAEGSLESTSSADFNHVFLVNVGGTFNVCKAALPYLRKRSGAAIINIASDLGLKAIPSRIAYCPSKAAVIMLTHCLAVELAPHIRANCILPGLVETPMIHHRFDQAADPDAVRASMASMYPLKRIGATTDMAAAAVFLASDESSFITGSEMPVCGGSQILR